METSSPLDGRVRVVVATTVLLSFISFWRAAAIVLSDLGSTAFYVGGIVEQAIGKAAPWFVLGVMLFAYAVRAVYVESCTMFTRGGVYRVVKEAMGGPLAKLSVFGQSVLDEIIEPSERSVFARCPELFPARGPVGICRQEAPIL